MWLPLAEMLESYPFLNQLISCCSLYSSCCCGDICESSFINNCSIFFILNFLTDPDIFLALPLRRNSLRTADDLNVFSVTC